MATPLPLPAVPISVRVATLDDLAFIDALQKKHSRQLGFFPRAQIEGYITKGWMLIAEDAGGRVGYVASRDRYLKRDELGAIFQLCVEPGRQRGLIGATLLKAAFERAAYGCRLFCCWCAQDLAANHFWEAMGFTPIAFRTGSATKGKGKSPRVHIFWQRRIRAGDTGDVSRGGTPWWFPSETNGGSIREDRLVLPIPPGVHWSEAKPIVLPGHPSPLPREEGKGLAISAARSEAKRVKKPATPPRPVHRIGGGVLRFAPVAPVEAPKETSAEKAAEKPKRPPRVKRKNDPQLIAATRELRDRWLEQVNAQPAIASGGKYDVSRTLGEPVTIEVNTLPASHPTKLLTAA